MKIRFFITLISFSFLGLLINGCGDDGGHSGHFSGGGDMNFEQQALQMEQEDLAKIIGNLHHNHFLLEETEQMEEIVENVMVVLIFK